MLIRLFTLIVTALIFTSCSGGGEQSAQKPTYDKAVAKSQPINHVFDKEQVARGEKLFNEKCVKCHKKNATGEPNWKQKDDKGNFPPPPLDGTAHAWHHPPELLHKYIKKGGTEFGGTMPGFKDELTDSQITDVIVWITTLWPKDIYDNWHSRNQATRG